MLLIVTTVLFLMRMLAPKAASCTVLPNMMKKNQLLGSLQLQGQVPPISVHNSPITGDISPSKITRKALANDHINYVSPLQRQLLKVQVPPSTPNPGTQVPASTTTPLRGSLHKSPLPSAMPDRDTSIP
jgi:hypothetical protein